MSTDPLEQAVLSGVLFEPLPPESPTRTPTSSRSGSPDLDNELLAALKDQPSSSSAPAAAPRIPTSDTNLGRTGIKGVIQDRDEALKAERAKKKDEMRVLREKMEKASLSAAGKTYFEEMEEKKLAEKMQEERAKNMYRRRRWRELRAMSKGQGFGHLREIGAAGYLDAVEMEDREVWVVVHLYDSSLERCALLDETLALLARQYHEIKFLRIRASSIGFATTESAPTERLKSNKKLKEDYDDENENDEDEDRGPNIDVDTDMLPTILVYKAGELEFSWVRADWEAGKDGLGELLKKTSNITSR
jgi:hypothetical protein